jgi:prepilin-type N-terminal cleavage/methylation domain-containing protein
MTSVRKAVRKGFTLVELLLVITIILLISTLFLGLTTGDGGGLPAGQRLLASSIRTARAMALMNRGPGTTGVTYNGRYRLLILNDPNDEANHLRQFVIAVGGVGSADPALAGRDPSTIINTADAAYTWFSPEPPQLLPTGVVFVPPASDTTTTMDLAVEANTRRSLIGQLADQAITSPKDSPASSPPWMEYAPTTQPMTLGAMTAEYNPKRWYYVELQGSGSSNHLGRVLLVLAKGVVRNTSAGRAAIDVGSANQFAAISLRPNGDISMTLDADEMDKAR